MEHDAIMLQVQRLDVRRGDTLYIRLPTGMTEKKIKVYAENIHDFFKHLNVKILIGDEEIEFIVVGDEDDAGQLN